MGYYSVVVTDAAGCSSTAYGYVSQTIMITAATTPTPATCLGSDGAAIAFGAGGAAPYTYLWSDGATTQSVTGLTSGYYTVTVQDANGCIGTGGAYISASTPVTATSSATPSSCTSATGTASVTPAGGTPPYNVTWYTWPTTTTGLSLSGLAAGFYSFHITDAAGCIRDGSVHVPPADVITATGLVANTTCPATSGAITVSPSGGVTPYSYSWSTGATTAGISGLGSGGYSVVITDVNGCSISKYYDVLSLSPMTVGISSADASCIFASDGSIAAIVSGGTPPYSYTWTTGATTAAITGLPAGPYYVDVTDASGCSANRYVNVGYNPAGTGCYCTISGTVYNDANGNCVQDAGEAGIPHIQVYCSGIGYTYTDASGYYSFQVPSGTYTISETVETFWPLSACQLNDISVTAVAAAGCTHTVNFANTSTPIHDMHISTWDYNMPIPGNSYTQIVLISNDGTFTEGSALATYRTDGQILAPSFIPGGLFTGSPYWYSTGSALPSLAPGSAENVLLTYSVPTTIPLSTLLLFNDSVAYTSPISTWLSDYTPWNNVNAFSTYTTASYDPNFKEVSPRGSGPTGLITRADSVLEYMVHFQNTGTAVAENVVVLDTLDNNLDWTTLRPVFMSANGVVDLTQSGSTKIAKFTFNHINLPTAASDSVTSSGLFTYTIKTKAGLPDGSQFKNRAAIYFDYNAPVITNSTINTLLGTTTGVQQVASSLSFSVYPNPAGNVFYTQVNSPVTGSTNIVVSDITGRVVIEKPVAIQAGMTKITTDAGQLAAGIYLVSLTGDIQAPAQKLAIIK